MAIEVDPDVLRIIEKLDKRIEAMQQAKEVLFREFETRTPADKPKVVLHHPSANTPHEPRKVQRPLPGRPSLNRKQSIIDFLKRNGPTTRGEIIKTLNIPRGTVGFYLTQKDTFVQTEGDKWTVKAGI